MSSAILSSAPVSFSTAMFNREQAATAYNPCAGMTVDDMHQGIEMAWHNMTIVDANLNNDTDYMNFWHAVPTAMMVNGIDTGYKLCVASDKPSLFIGKPYTDSYSLLNTHEVMALVKGAMVGIDLKLVSCGTLNGRSKWYKSYELPSTIGRKDHKSYITLIGSIADRQTVTQIGMSVTKIVCANTYAIALTEMNAAFRSGDGVKIKHTKNAAFKLPKIADYIEQVAGASTEFFSILEKLENTPVKDDSAKAIFAGFLGNGEEMSTRKVNTIDRLMILSKTGLGNGNGSLGDLFNAVTDFYSHESAGGDDRMKQWESSEFGSGMEKKQEFLPLISNAGNRMQTIAKGKRSLELTTAAMAN
jgi:hypothetical protein